MPASTERGLDESADREFREFYRTYHAFVWRTARRLGTPPARLDDIVQEVFLSAYRQRSGFEGRSSIRTWLYAIAANTVRSDHRRQFRHTRRLDAVRRQGISKPGGDVADLHTAVDLLDHLLGRLAPKQRDVFILIALEDVPAQEVAQALGISHNTVHSRLRLAREHLARALERQRAQERRVG